MLAGLVGIIAVLVAGAIGGWRYINFVPALRTSLPPLPEPNGYLKARAALLPLHKMRPSDIWPDGPPGPLRSKLAPIRGILEDVRAALRLDWRLPAPTASFPSFPENVEFSVCARAFAAESRLARMDGDGARAIQASLDDMELGSKLARGAAIFPRIVAQACHALGLHQAEASVRGVPAAVVPDALSRVRKIRLSWPPVSEMLEVERATMLALETHMFHDSERQGLSRKIEMARFWQHTPGAFETMHLLFVPRRTALAHMDYYFQRQIAESRLPVRQRVQVPIPDDPWTRAIMSDSTFDNPWKWERARTDLGLLEVALAVRMHYLQHGRYPTRLPEISKQWLPAIPQDLWDQPIAYRLKDGKPVIYSLGPDGKDDAGSPVEANRLTPETRGDLVFGHLYRRRQRR